MTYQHATKLALECVDKELHSLAVHANLADWYEADYPAAISASKRRKELKRAIEVLTITQKMF